MLYLIDGYNVTKGDPATRDSTLEVQRDALVARLRVGGAGLLGPGRIIVVFDGEGRLGISNAGTVPVEVRFAPSADDLIVKLAADASEQVVVVTSDRELAARVDAHGPAGVRRRGRETLYANVKPTRARRGSTRYPASTVGLPKGANKVTEELKGLWLTDEKE